MYKYSPISKIYIKNFRNIGEVTLSFEDSPIISLIGENEAGKTSVVKAFSVCALHATPRNQKDFIRDGTSGFGVAIELEDGTLVTRLKTDTVNRYTVKKPDGTVWDAKKLEGLPVEVQHVMGLIEEPETKEFLQVRTYEDQLLFVVTPASTNYKVMYDALKVGQLTNAIKIGSKEANALKQEVASNETGIETLTSSLRGIITYDIEPLLSIKSRLSKELSTVIKLSKLADLINSIEMKKNQLGALSNLDKYNVSTVNELEVNKLNSIIRLANNIANAHKELEVKSQAESLEIVDPTVINRLKTVLGRKSDLDNKIKEVGAYSQVGNAEEVNETILDHLIKASSNKRNIDMKSSRLNIIEPTGAILIEQKDFDIVYKGLQVLDRLNQVNQLLPVEKQINDYCKQMADYIKSLGAAVEICPNCGESVVIDIDKYAS